jgi:hypothetical protein
MKFLMGLQEEKIVSRLTFFGANGVKTFQGFKSMAICSIHHQCA